MTETDWLTCNEPTRMLEYLHGRASYRKLRLFAVACGTLVAQGGKFPEGDTALSASERYADRLIGTEELRAAQNVAWESYSFTSGTARVRALGTATRAAEYDVTQAVSRTVSDVREYLGLIYYSWLCDLIRDIFGNPFRPVVAAPHWRTSAVVGLTESVYEDRFFDRLPILADALEDAGCDNTDVLAHCRGDGPHVRGCWVVDLILGKE
jgi:hypothetical protein